MPSMAFSAMRTTSQIGISRKTPGSQASADTRAPTTNDPPAAASVTWLAVTPRAARRVTNGRRRAWNFGLIW